MTPKAGCLFGKEGSPLNPYHSYLYFFNMAGTNLWRGLLGQLS